MVTLGVGFEEVQGGTLDIPNPCLSQSSSSLVLYQDNLYGFLLEELVWLHLPPLKSVWKMLHLSGVLIASLMLICNGQVTR